jgi:GR25 family glycosyltransferase involved in LPS biosynthesis
MKNYLSKIYVIHYTKLIERKKHMISEFDKWNVDIPWEIFEPYDQEDISQLDIIEHFDMMAFRGRHSREMKTGEISLCTKYKKILQKIIAEDEGDYFLILEDDVIFKEDPLKYINNLIAKCEAENINFDCIFMGEAALRVGDNRDVFAKKPYPSTNGLCTVLYTRSAIERLFASLENYRITQPMDWEFNDRFRDLEFEVYWGKAITEHGSVTAVHDPRRAGLKSSLRSSY